jgi:hypothetical protein
VPCNVAVDVADDGMSAWIKRGRPDGWIGVAWVGPFAGPYLGSFTAQN